jgi:dual specificity MAP kinase phosphatase
MPNWFLWTLMATSQTMSWIFVRLSIPCFILTTSNCATVQWERIEMCNMSKASEISKGVWLGPSPDLSASPEEQGSLDIDQFDVLIEANDLASLPGPRYLERLHRDLITNPVETQLLQFPSSGSIVPQSDTSNDVEDFITTIRWMYYLTHPDDELEADADDDVPMDSAPSRTHKILIHCADGYTESTLLAIAYYIFAEGVPLHEAWLKLHCEKGRNFFAYPSDVVFLRGIQHRLLQESPAAQALNLSHILEPEWLAKMDGSLPSRILPYMYLGNLAHANNPDLLRGLGIGRVLSIGESVSWTEQDFDDWGEDNLMFISQVQDNGVDSLTQEFDRCLNFIGKSIRACSEP